MRTSLLVSTLIVLAGCSHPRAGDDFSVIGGISLYTDEAGFHDEVQRQKAGLSADEEHFRLFTADRIVPLSNGAHVQVIESVPDGAKVVVVSGQNIGKIGWITYADLRSSGNRTESP